MSGGAGLLRPGTTLAAAWRKAASASVVKDRSSGSGMRSIPPSVLDHPVGSGC